MRAKAIHTIVKVYRPIKYPTDKLTELLAFDNEGDTLAFMRELLLQPDEDGKIQLGSGYQAFSEIVSDTYKYGCKVVDNKLSCPLAEVTVSFSNKYRKVDIQNFRQFLAAQ
jgi:hypothetical protein